MVNINDKGINLLISAVEQNPKQFFWVRTPDLLQQVYVSRSFNAAWGKSEDTLFEQPMSLMSALVQDGNQDLFRLYDQRAKGKQEEREKTILSRIYSVDNSILYVRDSCFSIYDTYGNVVGAAGVGQIISESEWFYDLEGKVKEPSPLDLLKRSPHAHHLVEPIPDKVSNLNVIIPCKKIKDHYYISTTVGEIKLTKRQLECIYCFFEGMTAKQTAKYLRIAPDTVNEHLQIVFKKLGCTQKLEFAKLIKHNNK